MASILRHETNGCFCCCPAQPASASTSTGTNDLDASLHELGMLSAVTDSRRDYLLERLSRSARNVDSGPHHSGLCVLAMNSAYIADFSFVPPGVVAESPPSPSETVPLLTLRRPRALRRRQYFYQPYDYPWRQRLVEEVLRTQDVSCTNKSNPGSPSKLSVAGGIVRSKSLDDLSAKAAGGTKADIETVSRKISNLHVG
ncbi:hypothetical protein HPB50_015532 [Hyalomma asiaticum]|uniref:Uncharacterized protein n=1 Tax=Hyalomma asiaticum TaxID=266040 RepID=A0ACB7S1D5_HYAAI|nr:hypothetical protein HPB50_028469 [Hyalomma asiaticum]KAH6928425.1 hypothetical protein HPB50_015532 [Hyalomma asiaticum]